jgi:hypothetical protein
MERTPAESRLVGAAQAAAVAPRGFGGIKRGVCLA